ncbi:MAG: hypothetical protein GY869_25460 [Planctomycetes bacterium]|nr:hypothetical protein [Planctomycetota bacterium]
MRIDNFGLKRKTNIPWILDTLLKLIHDDGYSTGEASIFQRGRQLACVDASKDGERWVVYAEDRYTAVVELMKQLGWELWD